MNEIQVSPFTCCDLSGKPLLLQAIIRQITASVTFLPLLQDACTFDLLVACVSACTLFESDISLGKQVYTDSTVEVPQTWEESDPKYINNQQVCFSLRCLSSLTSLGTGGPPAQLQYQGETIQSL